jgi:hypothetical protein
MFRRERDKAQGCGVAREVWGTAVRPESSITVDMPLSELFTAEMVRPPVLVTSSPAPA